jgi:hypothetical protein
MMYSVELDISSEMGCEEVVNFASEYGCSATMIEEFGPGGGNPVYRFASEEKSNVIRMICEVLWTDPIEAENLVDYS